MSYAAAIDQLNAMVPELYTGSGAPRRKFSLEEIGVLLCALGNPQRRFPSVLIAGTNGKGSTAATLASVLTTSGVRTGLYTSPHLARANERIRVDRAEIDDDSFATLYFRVREAAERLVVDDQLPQLPSFFEILTALAFLRFADARVQIAVLEVGMGGRLDATNVVNPLLSVITDISLDHTEWLGGTISAITREKAGVLRSRGTLITLRQHGEADLVLDEVTAGLSVQRVDASRYLPPEGSSAACTYCVEALNATIRVDSPLIGTHQQRNVALAIAAAVELAGRHGFPVTPATLAEGIRKTRWPGRLERVNRDGVEWILDVAHNPAGALALRAGLEGGFPGRRLRTLIFGCLRDKPVGEMARILFPLFEQVVLAPIHTTRAAPLEDLVRAAKATGTDAAMAGSVGEALQLALQNVTLLREERGLIVVAGSVYLVGEVRVLLLANSGDEL